jgi:hypothetical protein
MKLCYMCKQLEFDPGSQGYSEVTPGSDTIMRCQKGHWDVKELCGEGCLAEALEKALTCKDYKQADWFFKHAVRRGMQE